MPVVRRDDGHCVAGNDERGPRWKTWEDGKITADVTGQRGLEQKRGPPWRPDRPTTTEGT